MGWSLIDFTADLTGRGSDASSTPARHRCEKSQQEPEFPESELTEGPPDQCRATATVPPRGASVST